jgi:hypothetical protein
MADVTDIEDIDPIPGIDHPSDGLNLHYEHEALVLLYNILLQLRDSKGLLEDIKQALLDSP